MKINVLVTGAHGQLGRTIKELYEKNLYKVDLTFASKEDLDITKIQNLKKFFSLKNFHYCINCAAYTNVEQAEKIPEPAFKINSEGVKNLALVCKENNSTLIHISTDYVFDGEKEQPYTTNDATNPINEYGRSKLEGEKHIQDILKTFYIIRTSWLYSKKYGKNFYRFIVSNAKEGKSLNITTSQTGCPTDTEDLSNFIINKIISKKPPYGIYHFCNSRPMTWYEFAKQILKEHSLTDKAILNAVSEFKTVAKRPKYSVLA